MHISLQRVFFSFLCLVIYSGSVHAEAYYAADAVPPTLLAPPPEVGSEAWQQTIDTIIHLQQSPDPTQIALAKAERHMSPEMVALAVNPLLTRRDFPALYVLLDRTGGTSKGVTDAAKQYWNTKRPYLSDKRIKALIEPHDNPSYPSGHATGSYVWAEVLGMVLPKQREAFMARAAIIAQHRVLVGMHFPHDLTAGHDLSLLIVGGLLQNAAFQKDLTAARQELASHLGL